ADLLEKAKGIKPATPRERDYIDALTVFYSNTDKLDHPHRADAYAAAMAGLYPRYPHHPEAGVLYSLALLSSGPERDTGQTNAKKAVAILSKLFDEQPDHPGIAHYIIHACDNPGMAAKALQAARKYAAIAPSSAHAVHMPSHIFARLGLWQDDIQSNLAAVAVAEKMSGMHMHHRMHSMDFLNYAYLQIGDDKSAKAQIDRLATFHKQEIEEDYHDYYDRMVAEFTTRYALERRQWKETLALEPVPDAGPGIQAVAYWARAVAAGYLHNAVAAQDALNHYEERLEAFKKSPKGYLAGGLKDEHDEV